MEHELYRERTNLRTIMVALLVFVIGIGLIILSGELGKQPILRALSRDLGSLLVATVCIALLWELAAKRSLIAELLAATQLAERIQVTGVTGLQARWYDDVPWTTLLADADHVDIFVAYGISWRGVLAGDFARFASRPGTTCRVILPDPENKLLMQTVGSQFGRSAEEVRQRILAARIDFLSRMGIGAHSGRFQVWYASRPPLFSFFMFGNHAVVTLYKHHSAQTNVIGMVVRRGGSFHEFLTKELAAFVTEPGALARRVDPPA